MEAVPTTFVDIKCLLSSTQNVKPTEAGKVTAMGQ